MDIPFFANQRLIVKYLMNKLSTEKRKYSHMCIFAHKPSLFYYFTIVMNKGDLKGHIRIMILFDVGFLRKI